MIKPKISKDLTRILKMGNLKRLSDGIFIKLFYTYVLNYTFFNLKAKSLPKIS